MKLPLDFLDLSTIRLVVGTRLVSSRVAVIIHSQCHPRYHVTLITTLTLIQGTQVKHNLTYKANDKVQVLWIYTTNDTAFLLGVYGTTCNSCLDGPPVTATSSLRLTTAPGGAMYTASRRLTVSSQRHLALQYPFGVAHHPSTARRPTSM